MNKPRGRPFQPGNTYGRGRPKGSRNRSKTPGQDLLDKYEVQLVGTCIKQASQGDKAALRMCMERISPPRRGARISFRLPPIRTAQDVECAAEKITQAIGRGTLTPAEGEAMMNALQSRLQIIKDVQWESRLEKVEQKVA